MKLDRTFNFLLVFHSFFSTAVPSAPFLKLSSEDCTVQVEWETSSTTGCPIKSYNLYYREVKADGKEANWTLKTIENVNINQYNLFLECNKRYEVGITALNSIGESEKRLEKSLETSEITAKKQGTVALRIIQSLVYRQEKRGRIKQRCLPKHQAKIFTSQELISNELRPSFSDRASFRSSTSTGSCGRIIPLVPVFIPDKLRDAYFNNKMHQSLLVQDFQPDFQRSLEYKLSFCKSKYPNYSIFKARSSFICRCG